MILTPTSTIVWLCQGSSVVRAPVELVHRGEQALEVQSRVLLILLLDHSILLQKLSDKEVPDCITRWFTSCLCQRRQRTKIGDCESERCTISAGFGPVGFIMHINDLRTCLLTR